MTGSANPFFERLCPAMTEKKYSPLVYCFGGFGHIIGPRQVS
jgi:hypothetical protein